MEFVSSAILSLDGTVTFPLHGLNAPDTSTPPVYVEKIGKSDTATEIQNRNDNTWGFQIYRKNGEISSFTVRKELKLESGTIVLTRATLLKDKDRNYKTEVVVDIISDQKGNPVNGRIKEVSSIMCRISSDVIDNNTISDLIINGLPVTITNDGTEVYYEDRVEWYARKQIIEFGKLSLSIVLDDNDLCFTFALGEEFDETSKVTGVFIGGVLQLVLKNFVRFLDQISEQSGQEIANGKCLICDVSNVLESQLVIKELDASKDD